MTKYEAIAAIIDSRNRMKAWADYISEVREIINQIDQPPVEFSVREMFSHLKRIERMVELHSAGAWTIRGHYECDADVYGHGIDSLRAKLAELAKPPEPKTVMVEMPLAVARCCAEYRDGDIAKACRAALEKAKL